MYEGQLRSVVSNIRSLSTTTSEIWRAFDNHYWPALYFVDSDGTIRGQYFGEGPLRRIGGGHPGSARNREGTVSVTGSGVEAPADWDHLGSPETYLGSDRQDPYASPQVGAQDFWPVPTSRGATH